MGHTRDGSRHIESLVRKLVCTLAHVSLLSWFLLQNHTNPLAGNRDASLSLWQPTCAVDSEPDERHAPLFRQSSTDTGGTLAPSTPFFAPMHSPRGSKCCRDHTNGRESPAWSSEHS